MKKFFIAHLFIVPNIFTEHPAFSEAFRHNKLTWTPNSIMKISFFLRVVKNKNKQNYQKIHHFYSILPKT